MHKSFSDYERKYQSFKPRDLSWPRNLELAAMGLSGESGEFTEVIKKLIFHNHDYTPDVKDKLVLELGDILWYLAYAANAINVDLEYVADMNINKLSKRYPNGFTPERSINREEYTI